MATVASFLNEIGAHQKNGFGSAGTALRVEELRHDAARNDVVTKDERRAGIETDLATRVSPFVPNTAARRNITMRKLRDRLHDDVPPRTPDDVTKR